MGKMRKELRSLIRNLNHIRDETEDIIPLAVYNRIQQESLKCQFQNVITSNNNGTQHLGNQAPDAEYGVDYQLSESDEYSQLAFVPTVDVVGFKDEMNRMLELLTSAEKKLDVISIIGMAGQGKTTLAREVYESSTSKHHFDVRAWCCVSQEYNIKKLLLSILGCITQLTGLISEKSETDLYEMLHKQLYGRRYLIVIDDVWTIDAFDALRCCFRDQQNRSRIVFTSRDRSIGSNVKSHIIELSFLTEKESWDLLERQIYGAESCPTEFRQVGKKIAQKCKGLPLAIVVVAGVLTPVQIQEFWEQVAENLSSYLAGDPKNKWAAALDLSYIHLPEYLKPLFLYLGAFPEDKEIPTDKLIWLWIAEGFVHKKDHTNLEIQAEANLMELISRSLVMVAKRRSDGRVQSCYIHDLLRGMCLTKAKETSFMQQIHLHKKLADSTFYQRRLSIILSTTHGDAKSSSSRPLVGYLPVDSVPPIRTLLFFNVNKSLPLSKEAAESIFSALKLLRVLHCESTTVDDHDVYSEMMRLVYLRYMSIRTSLNDIPQSVSSLRNLETLIIKGVKGEMVVPETIWELEKLSHLHIDPRAKFLEAPNSSSKLDNLQTLSTPSISFGEEKMLINKVPNLRKLRCVFTESHSYYNNIYPDFRSLAQLESLEVLCYGRVNITGQFKLPPNLKRLSISLFRLQWSQISAFQNLEILKLRTCAVHDEIWDTGNNVFANLKSLMLEKLNIKEWEASDENFPLLEKLVLVRCRHLKVIPSSLGEICTLERIEVLWCHPSAAKSAKEIQEEQNENGNNSLEIHIYPPTEKDPNEKSS